MLHALASAADAGGDLAVARRELRVDPLLVWAARARLRALVAAERHKAQDAGPRELCQRAFLRLAGRPFDAVGDAAGLTAAYASAQFERPRGKALQRSYTLTLAASALAAATIAVLAVVLTRGPAAPPSERRYEQLATSGVLEDVFCVRLPALITALDVRGRNVSPAELEADASAAIARVIDLPAEQALGSEVATALRAFMNAVRDSGLGRGGSDALERSVDALDAALLAAQIPFYVDATVLRYTNGQSRPVAFVYRVEGARPWRAGEHVVRALRLRRADKLLTHMLLMGMTRPGMREGLVLLDETDEDVMRHLLPALAVDAPLVFSRQAPDDFPGREAFERAAGAIVRRELAAALGSDAPRAAHTGELVARRERVFDVIDERLRGAESSLRRPRTLTLPEGWLDGISGALAEDRATLATLDGELRAPAHLALLRHTVDVVARAIEMHEVQHRLDDLTPIPMPPALEALVGPAHENDPGDRALHARAEMSAYLATLGRDDATLGVNILDVARFLLMRASAGAAETPGAQVILEGLRAELGIEGGALVEDKRVRRERVAELALAIAARPAGEVRAAASRLWASSFGRPLPALAPDGPMAVPGASAAPSAQ